MKLFTAVLAALGVASPILGSTYYLEKNLSGQDFYNAFLFQNIPDPTHGRVNFVDKSTAVSQNLTYVNGDAFIIRADYKTKLSPGGPGRNSVRLQSNKMYKNVALIFDIRHMPQGCGTWPAVWMRGENWPYDGEIDILEGVNDVSPNIASLHTGPGCTMPATRHQNGQTRFTDCNGFDNSNKGCGVQFPTTDSYGPAFNRNGGGWFALERSDTQIRVWFWPRNGDIPFDLLIDSNHVNPDSWGTPTAYFPQTESCNINNHFASQRIMIDLTFCGYWAGNDYGLSSCPGTCEGYVNNNPAAFTEAYFDFASLKIYS